MKREIKFRGKSLKYGNWLFGSLWIDEEGTFIIHEKKLSVSEVDPSTVGQYTGLKDKNGKEIYEGDIVKGVSHKSDKYSAIRRMVGV